MKSNLLCLFFFTIVCSLGMSAQGLTCNGQVNLSLDDNCGIENLSLDAFLEGDNDPSLYTLVILGTNDVPVTFGNPNDPNYVGNFIGQCIDYQIIESATGNYCWGLVCLEDKIIPSVDCECETPYLADGVTPNPDCTFYCYETWDLEILEDLGKKNNEILPDYPDATDNCGDLSPSTVQLVIEEGPNCGDHSVFRTFLYTYTNFDGSESTISCTQHFLFQSLDIFTAAETGSGTWDGYESIFQANSGDRPMSSMYLPQHTVLLPCGTDTSPAGIAEYYDVDTPGRPVGKDRDDHDDTPNIIEHNEGYPYAYPYVVIKGWSNRYHAKPIDNNICNVYAAYEDLDYDACADDCYGNSKIARTWTILDWCDASFINYTQVIKRIDTEGPSISGPDYTVSVDPWGCAADFEVPYPEHLHDACDQNPTWSFSVPAGVTVDGYVVKDLPKGETIITYEGTDCCGNLTRYDFTVTVVDNTPPTVIVKENIVVQLTNDISADDGIAKLYAVDVDNFSHDGCGPVHFEIRRPIEDWCSPGNKTFNNDGHADDHPDDTDGGAFVKFCCEDAIDIDSNGVAFGLHQVIIRVWDDGDMDGTYGSAGDNYNESWANVRVEDKLAPIVVCPPTQELACEEDYLNYDLTGRPYASKTCTEIPCEDDPSDRFKKKPANSAPFLGEEIPAYNPSCRRGAIERTWNCGGKECTQWIIMRDTEDGPLDITFPDDATVDCIEADPGYPSVVERLCELTGVSLESDTFNFEDGACYKILNHWTVINWCDYDASDSDLNDNLDPTDDGFVPGYYSHTQVIKLIDTEKPVLSVSDTCFAANSECVGTGLEIWAAASDNGICGSAWLKWEVEVDMWSDWEVDYTYSSYFPATTGSGAGTSNEFYLAPTGGVAAMPIYMGNQVVVNSTIQSDLYTGGVEQSVEEFTGVSANSLAIAANLSDKVEYISYLSLFDIDFSAECIAFEMVADPNDPNYSGSYGTLGAGEYYRYYFNFPAGHNISGVSVAENGVALNIISSNEIVVEVGPGFNFNPGSTFKLNLDSVGEPIHIALPDDLPHGCGSQHRVLWNVKDGCGNTTSRTSYFTIEDKKKPTPYMLNLSTALMQNGQVELWAKDFDAGSFDNCTTDQEYLKYTFSSNVPPQLLDANEEDPWYDADGVAKESDYENGEAEEWNGVTGSSARIFDEDDLALAEANGGFLPLEVYVWDLCGNYDYAVVNLKLIFNDSNSPRANIAGTVATEDGRGVEGVEILAISDQNGYPYSIPTSDDGSYMFEYNPMDFDYELSGEKNNDWLNGVTTLDIVLIQRHILDLEELDSPYKLIAADANNDAKVSAIDLIQLRKLILGVTSEISTNESWRFMDATQTMNASNPWPFTESLQVLSLENDMLNEDFIAVKTGDVNGSAVANLLDIQVDQRSSNALNFDIEEVELGAGVKQLNFTSSNFSDINGFQMTLDAEISEITEVITGTLNFNDSNVAMHNGSLVISWNAEDMVTSEETVLFSISVVSNDDLRISDRVISSEAYQGENLEILPIQLINAGEVNFLGQNEPNPFKNQTAINFTLVKDGMATFSVYDVTGKLVTSSTNYYAKGDHKMVLDNRDLSASGNVLYYKLESEDFSATKKMIILK